MRPPETRFAKSGEAHIAYQVVGAGPPDLVYVPDFMSNLVYAWEYPRWRDFYRLLAGSFRLILFDKRGTGLSDHGGQFATLETRMEDLHAVLDAAESTRTVILASHLGRPKGKVAPEFSLLPVAGRLSELIGRKVVFASDCIGEPAKEAVAEAAAGSHVVLLENLRFHAE